MLPNIQNVLKVAICHTVCWVHFGVEQNIHATKVSRLEKNFSVCKLKENPLFCSFIPQRQFELFFRFGHKNHHAHTDFYLWVFFCGKSVGGGGKTKTYFLNYCGNWSVALSVKMTSEQGALISLSVCLLITFMCNSHQGLSTLAVMILLHGLWNICFD